MQLDVKQKMDDITSELVGIKNNPGNLANIYDVLWPVGSYYETADNNFNPNDAWGGTWTKESYTYLESIGRASKSGSIGKQNGGSTTLTASVPSGNTFLCWDIGVATDGWCGAVYCPQEGSTSAGVWNGSYGQSGTGTIHGQYFYYKKVTKYRWHRTA